MAGQYVYTFSVEYVSTEYSVIVEVAFGALPTWCWRLVDSFSSYEGVKCVDWLLTIMHSHRVDPMKCSLYDILLRCAHISVSLILFSFRQDKREILFTV